MPFSWVWVSLRVMRLVCSICVGLRAGLGFVSTRPGAWLRLLDPGARLGDVGSGLSCHAIALMHAGLRDRKTGTVCPQDPPFSTLGPFRNVALRIFLIPLESTQALMSFRRSIWWEVLERV